jgi:hypothetical protein
MLDWFYIKGHGRPLKCVKRLLSEYSYNASSVRSVSQWMIIKIGYNVSWKEAILAVHSYITSMGKQKDFTFCHMINIGFFCFLS